MTQHNKSGAELSAVDVAVETAEKFMTLVLAGQCTYYGNRIRIEVKNGVRVITSEPDVPAPVADAGVKRPASEYVKEFGHSMYHIAEVNALVTSLELQLTQAHGKDVELSERVKELEADIVILRDQIRWKNEQLGEVIPRMKKAELSLSSAASGKDGE